MVALDRPAGLFDCAPGVGCVPGVSYDLDGLRFARSVSEAVVARETTTSRNCAPRDRARYEAVARSAKLEKLLTKTFHPNRLVSCLNALDSPASKRGLRP